MALTARAALELASHEALVRQTYKDSVGVLTWCVGMTSATGHRVDRYVGKAELGSRAVEARAEHLRHTGKSQK